MACTPASWPCCPTCYSPRSRVYVLKQDKVQALTTGRMASQLVMIICTRTAHTHMPHRGACSQSLLLELCELPVRPPPATRGTMHTGVHSQLHISLIPRPATSPCAGCPFAAPGQQSQIGHSGPAPCSPSPCGTLQRMGRQAGGIAGGVRGWGYTPIPCSRRMHTGQTRAAQGIKACSCGSFLPSCLRHAAAHAAAAGH